MPSLISPPPSVERKAFGRLSAQPQKRRIIIFSDFDGTISLQDTGHILFDAHGCGPTRRSALDDQIRSGERTFKDASEEMYASLDVPFDDGFELMASRLDLDPGFKTFHTFCLAHSIPFHVISAGLKPVLRRVLDECLGEEESSTINIVANDAEITRDGKEWKPIWRHVGTETGHDKVKSIREEVAGDGRKGEGEGEGEGVPLIVFIGDGVSDLPAAREADVLFARKGLRLEGYCVEHGIKYLPFDSFGDIQSKLEGIMDEDEERTLGRGNPVRFNPRANMWRRASSRKAVPRYVVMSPSREEKMFLWPDAFTELRGDGMAATSMDKAVV